MDAKKIEAVAKAICGRENIGNSECKACRNVRYDANDGPVELPEGCLGLGYEYLAVIAIEAYRKWEDS